MELYYKDLISKEATLDELVDDLVQMVQGADEFAQETAEKLPRYQKVEITSKMNRLKETCMRIREQVVGGAQATDKVLRRNPYSLAGVAFGLGLLVGVLACKKRLQSSN